MVEVVLTAKTNSMVKRDSTFALFSTTSTSYVVVTDAIITGVVILLNYVWWCRARNTVGNTSNVKLVGSVSGDIQELSFSNTSLSQQPTTQTLRSLSVSETFTLEAKTSTGATEVEANSLHTVEAEFTNISDFNQKVQVTEMKIFSADNVTKGLEGIFSQFLDEAITSTTLDSIMSKFIFTNNDGLLLFDWSGFKVAIQ